MAHILVIHLMALLMVVNAPVYIPPVTDRLVSPNSKIKCPPHPFFFRGEGTTTHDIPDPTHRSWDFHYLQQLKTHSLVWEESLKEVEAV